MREMLIGLVLLIGALPAAAQSRDENWSRCSTPDPNIRIGGCTALIQSGKKKSDLATAYFNRGHAYSQKGLFDQGIDDYTRAVALAPDYAAAYYNRGNNYRKKGFYDQAIDDYTRAIAITPHDPHAYGNRGFAYEKMGNRDLAIDDYRTSLRLSPNEELQKHLEIIGATP
jgi:tetratricopeptide (TPR) repeat protein